MLGNQAEERSRFCDSHGGCALGDPHGRVEESIDKVDEAEECGIEEISKQLAMAGDHDKITVMINLFTNEFTSSPQANHRKVILVLVFVSLIVLVDWIFHCYQLKLIACLSKCQPQN
ncbi:hypothetical protein Scep_005070 [Stephania cephalantha]|uniref:Uncharacterized protein n=1 Tax=Stephania cephalantha TaxID=152367 RepID=A0AAP0KTM2_9MAGN